MIGSDGYYGIYKQVEGTQTLIDQVHLDFSAAIAQGKPPTPFRRSARRTSWP